MKWFPVVFIAMCAGLCISAQAGSTLADLADGVVPGLGNELDSSANQAVNDVFVQSATPVLQELIMRSRAEAVRAGVQPIPPEVRRQLAGFIPDSILNLARYRVESGGSMTLQAGAIQYGDARAITLVDVVVLKNQFDVLNNPTLWAHELTHVEQYQQWGVQGFAQRYLQNYEAVEKVAYDSATRYADWLKQKNERNASAWHLPDAKPQ
ncbi:MAG: eCIS core domain-containing protein [Stenotrophobium sp.]